MTKKKYGWLIVNAFLHWQKFEEHYHWFVEAGKKYNIQIEIKTNAEVLPVLEQGVNLLLPCSSFPDFIIFWDKDIYLAKTFEQLGIPVYNKGDAISTCDNKYATLLQLSFAKGFKIPKTIPAPMTYSNIGYTNMQFLESVEKNLGYPMIVKECYGSFGMQVYLINDRLELERIIKEKAGTSMLFQEFIQTSKGKDVRLQVVGNEVVASMYRYSENDFRANISNGGKMKSLNPLKEWSDIAVKACQVLELDFAGVDILFGKNHTPVVCEVNSNAHFKNIYSCTGINVAEKIMFYINNKQYGEETL